MKKKISNLNYGVRGRYATRYRNAHPDATSVNVHIWALLADFPWDGNDRQIAVDTWLRPGSAYKGYEGTEHDYFLSPEEKDRCREASHWLQLVQPAQHEMSPAANVNVFLLALWIVRPTQTNVPLRFEEAESGVRHAVRYLDRFQWILGQAADHILDSDLDAAGLLLPSLRAISTARKRLSAAMVLTLRGCVSRDWRVAFICFASALEGLLTHQTEPTSAALADSYAALMSERTDDRESALSQFKRLYAVRSGILHGHSYERDDPRRNLEELAEVSDAIRHTWARILESDDIREALEGDDQARRDFFHRIRQ